MSAFKDMVEKDIYGTFLNLDEFAEWHAVAGKRIRCVVDSDILDGRAAADNYGVAENNLVLYAKNQDLPSRQPAGQVMNVDGSQYIIMSWKDAMGMSEIELSEAVSQ